MSTDDLRARVADTLDSITLTLPRSALERPLDRAIAIVWSEAHRAGFNEAIEAGVAKAAWHARIGSTMRWNTVEECDAAVTAARQIAREIGDDLRALRKPEEGG